MTVVLNIMMIILMVTLAAALLWYLVGVCGLIGGRLSPSHLRYPRGLLYLLSFSLLAFGTLLFFLNAASASLRAPRSC